MGEEMNKSIWSKDYWKGAAKRFSSVRMLAVCAMLLALRIARVFGAPLEEVFYLTGEETDEKV